MFESVKSHNLPLIRIAWLRNTADVEKLNILFIF